jgi:hypothetical protein
MKRNAVRRPSIQKIIDGSEKLFLLPCLNWPVSSIDPDSR